MAWSVSFRVVASCSLSGTATIVPVGTLTALLRLRDLSKLLQPISSWAFPVSSGARGTSSILRMLSKPLLPGWKLKVNQSLLRSFLSRCIILLAGDFLCSSEYAGVFSKHSPESYFLTFVFKGFYVRVFACFSLFISSVAVPLHTAAKFNNCHLSVSGKLFGKEAICTGCVLSRVKGKL